jgi:hypothetical protein
MDTAHPSWSSAYAYLKAEGAVMDRKTGKIQRLSPVLLDADGTGGLADSLSVLHSHEFQTAADIIDIFVDSVGPPAAHLHFRVTPERPISKALWTRIASQLNVSERRDGTS